MSKSIPNFEAVGSIKDLQRAVNVVISDNGHRYFSFKEVWKYDPENDRWIVKLWFGMRL